VEWIAAGKRNREIGKILGRSDRTVQKHIENIMGKLHVETRVEVCAWWYENRVHEDNSAPAPSKPQPRLKRK
jgi:DNA-binding CsgD family transcriptional regulator